jgi:hypothetical protein
MGVGYFPSFLSSMADMSSLGPPGIIRALVTGWKDPIPIPLNRGPPKRKATDPLEGPDPKRTSTRRSTRILRPRT